jgi:hypothetical protein
MQAHHGRDVRLWMLGTGLAQTLVQGAVRGLFVVKLLLVACW